MIGEEKESHGPLVCAWMSSSPCVARKRMLLVLFSSYFFVGAMITTEFNREPLDILLYLSLLRVYTTIYVVLSIKSSTE